MNQLARVASQFRKFQVLQIATLSRAANRIFQAEGVVGKFIAAKQLTYILSTHAAMGGLMGLPAANIIGWAVAGLKGWDDDEPEDIELMLRREIGNKEVSDLILKGLPAYLGVDTSSRLGMGQTFAVMPFTEIKFTREGAAVAMAGLLGPSAAQVGQTVDGIGMVMEGHTQLGIAQMMPRGLRDAIKAHWYATEGVTRRNNTDDVAIRSDDLSAFDIAWQGLGWPTAALSDRMNMNRWLLLSEQTFNDRAKELKREYVLGGASEKMQARREWVDLQKTRRSYGFEPQSLKLLTDAPAEKRKREQDMRGGVFTSNTNRRFVESLME